MSHWQRLQKVTTVLLWLAIAVMLVWGQVWATPDADKVQALALERYGARAANTVAAWRKLLAESKNLPEAEVIVIVNTFFNRRILFEDDMAVWNQPDYWATPLELMGQGAGDCEDFAIAKYVTLQILGVSNEKLRLIYVRARMGGATSSTSVAHMVVGYYSQPQQEPMVLDNLVGSVRPASARSDLLPIYSFNSDGLWVGGAATSSADPTARLSHWRGVLERMGQEGFR
jgi:predicted transglutaminase-like cysteine proteinase